MVENIQLCETVYEMTWEFCWYFQEHNIPLYDSRKLFEAIYDWSNEFEKWYEKQDNADYIEEITKFSQKKIEKYLEESIL